MSLLSVLPWLGMAGWGWAWLGRFLGRLHPWWPKGGLVGLCPGVSQGVLGGLSEPATWLPYTRVRIWVCRGLCVAYGLLCLVPGLLAAVDPDRRLACSDYGLVGVFAQVRALGWCLGWWVWSGVDNG